MSVPQEDSGGDGCRSDDFGGDGFSSDGMPPVTAAWHWRLALGAVGGALAVLALLGTGSARGAEFFSASPPRAPRYPVGPTQSFHLTMRDGVRIAVDLTLPEGLPPGERVPTVLHVTRYWRDVELMPPLSWVADRIHRPRYASFFPRFGYAVLMVDARGSGASFGTRLHPWSEDEIADSREVVDWVVSQPWSNGRVGAMGASYAGTAAALVAATDHPAVRAVVPRFVEFDLYADNAFPGGIFHDHFVRNWSSLNRSLDAGDLPDHPVVPWYAPLVVRGVKPVDDDPERSKLRGALAEHAGNGDLFAAARALDHRDDEDPATGVGIEDFSLHRFGPRIERSGVAVFAWGSWMDGASARGVLGQFLSWSNPMQVVIGPWNHVALEDANPYQPADAGVQPSVDAQWYACLRFLDRFVRDGEPPGRLGRSILYFTMGEDRWKQASAWPPAPTEKRAWYLGRGRTLRDEEPTRGGVDRYEVDFEATTGTRNRWHTLLTDGDVVYGDLANGGRRLHYTSRPLPRGIEITGSPLLELFVAADAPDAALYAYLEDLAPDGRSHYLTEGQLRLIHRRSGTGFAARSPVPEKFQHSFRREDALPLVPGRMERVRLALLPTSARVRRGHRLRLTLAGHDAETFARIPESGPLTLGLRRGPGGSRLVLPVVTASGRTAPEAGSARGRSEVADARR